jgi:hypothetical protein
LYLDVGQAAYDQVLLHTVGLLKVFSLEELPVFA